MQRQSQGQWSCGAKSSYGGTDWQALEVQLTRTRTILQEILVHLQDVLRNLKSARPGETRRAQQTATPPPHATRDKRFQSTTTTTTTKTHTPGAAASDRYRAKPRPGGETKTETGQAWSFKAAGPEAAQAKAKATGEEKVRAGESRTFRAAGASARPGPTAGHANRERPRPESAFRAKAGPAGPERETRGRTTTGQKFDESAGQRTSRANRATGATTGQTTAGAGKTQDRATGKAGFRPDRERQRRARDAARNGGMNLKCAYDILCLDYPCSADEIKVAYRHMARLHHPDLGGDEEAMKDVNVAYELAMRFCAGPRRAGTAWAV